MPWGNAQSRFDSAAEEALPGPLPPDRGLSRCTRRRRTHNLPDHQLYGFLEVDDLRIVSSSAGRWLPQSDQRVPENLNLSPGCCQVVVNSDPL